MADAKKKGKGGVILLVLLLAILAAGIAGYLKPDLPVIGDLVSRFFKKGAEGVDKFGVYKLTIKQVAISPEEFNEGENVDLQVTIERVDLEDERREIWQSKQYGARNAKVGRDTLTATWADRPAEIEWRTGDKFVVKVWDRAGMGSTLLCEWETDPASKAFPLTGTHTFERVKGKIARVKGANQIVFEAERIGDLPAEPKVGG
jgi:hypothetical protein